MGSSRFPAYLRIETHFTRSRCPTWLMVLGAHSPTSLPVRQASGRLLPGARRRGPGRTSVLHQAPPHGGLWFPGAGLSEPRRHHIRRFSQRTSSHCDEHLSKSPCSLNRAAVSVYLQRSENHSETSSLLSNPASSLTAPSSVQAGASALF